MLAPANCCGPLLWFRVAEVDGRALIECASCDWIAVAPDPPDAAHAGAVVVVVDED